MPTFADPRDRMLTDDLCLYRDQIKKQKSYPSLKKDTKTQICVIGGGFTGVMSAYYLAQKGLKVVLIERHRIGWGASGRNGGQLIPGFGRDIREVCQDIGLEEGVYLYEGTLEALHKIKTRISKQKIACSYRPGLTIPAWSDKAAEDQEDYIHFLDTHCGHKMWMADKAETQRRLGTHVYAGAMVDDDDGGSMNPLAYLNHMASASAKEGVQIFEETPALDVRRETDGQCIISTPGGLIRAEQVVLAGDAYQGWLMPKLRKKYILLRTSMLATAILPEDLYAEILPSHTAVFEWCHMLNYYNKTADGRLIFGGGDSPLSGTPKEKRKAFTKIYDNMCDIFPKLQNVHISHWWSGYFSVTQKMTPEIGRLHGALYYAFGYSGHGIVPSHMAAHTIAEAIIADRKTGKKLAQPIRENSILTAFSAPDIPGAGHYDQILGRFGLFWHQIKDRFAG